MTPFFSVIIPLYNREKTITRAIQSVLSQTFQDFEIIIVDDCSSDTSGDIVKRLIEKDNRIIYLRNDLNSERCISRNRGIQSSQGKYICFLDSDDYHLPFHLERLYEQILLEGYPLGFLFTSAWNETEEGVRTKRMCPPIANLNLYHYFLNYTVNPQRWCVESTIAKHLLFDPAITICEDLDFTLRLVQNGYPVCQILEETTVYVASLDSFTHGDKHKWEKELFYLKRIFSKPELKSILPSSDTRRLVSMCNYQLAYKAFHNHERLTTIKYGLKSFFIYPKGYNKNATKDALIMLFSSLLRR